MKTCHDCKNCIEQLEGYSDWTVTGSSAECAYRLNPHMPIDDYASDEKQEEAYAYAEQCGGFREGGKLVIGVEDDAREEMAKHFGGAA